MSPRKSEPPRGKVQQTDDVAGHDVARPELAWRQSSPDKAAPCSDLAASALSTFRDVAALTSNLSLIADWRDELEGRIRRAALRFELCGLEAEEQEQLTQEVFAFTSLSRALADTLRRKT
jgi:hypothetical protein